MYMGWAGRGQNSLYSTQCSRPSVSVTIYHKLVKNGDAEPAPPPSGFHSEFILIQQTSIFPFHLFL